LFGNPGFEVSGYVVFIRLKETGFLQAILTKLNFIFKKQFAGGFTKDV